MRQLALALLAFLLGFALATPSRAQSAGAPLDAHARALEAYQSGRHELARELWLAGLEAAPEGSAQRAALLYNLGNAAFRLRRPLEAAAWYTASLRLAPRSEAAWHNLEFVRREAGLDPADRGDLTATARRFASALTLAESERFLLGVALLLALALAWEALRGSTASRAACLALLGMLGLALVPWCWRLAHADEALVFVTQPEGAALLSEPRAEATLVGRLAAATQAERVDALPGWWRVRSSEGAVGWIAAGAAVPLDSPFR